MTVFKKKVSEPWFTLIKKGKKTVEGRLDKGDFSEMEVGDVVIWSNGDDLKSKNIKTKIKKVTRYKTLYEMIKKERLKNVLPSPKIKTIQEGVNRVYRSPPVNYTYEKEKKYGVLAIEIEKI